MKMKTITKPVMMALIGLAMLLCVSAKAQLIWSDEFNGTSVNTSNWNFEQGAGGWGNQELQYYRSQNATVSGGVLNITARRESYGGAAYTSARINTAGKRTFTYGFLEASCRMPMGQGYWPAFWMIGQNFGSVGWPACGEIDIMEHVNSEARVVGTIHWNGPNGYSLYNASYNTSPGNWHRYQLNWNQYGMRWYVDGVQYHTANITNSINSTEEFHRPFFFILNLAIGGVWPGSPTSSTPFPAVFQVDYVRVYQQSNARMPGADEEIAKNGAEEQNNVRVYPNPVQDVLNYSVPEGLENHTLKMYDIEGREVISRDVRDVKESNSINVSTVKPGYYIMDVYNDRLRKKNRLRKKIKVQKE
jgi:beta-glucanase (GH16 family)